MASASFSIVYQFTAELFPTSIRTTAIGNCSAVSKVAAILSLLIDALADIWGPLPFVLMGSFALAAGISASLLPETVGLPLPSTLQDAIDIPKRQTKKGMFTCSNCQKEKLWNILCMNLWIK